MTRCLVLAEVVDGAVSAVTAEAVAAAAAVAEEVVLAVAGADPDVLLPTASFAGVNEVVTVDSGSSDRDHEATMQIAAAVIADVSPDVVIAPFTIRSTSFAAGLAHSLDLAFVADVVGLDRDESGAIGATRSVYAGRVQAHVTFPTDRPLLALVRSGIWDPADVGPTVAARSLVVELTPPKVRSLELVRPAGDVDLTRAEVIFSIGRGVGSKENISAFAAAAEKLGVALAASRPVVDAGWLPAVHQVGQTGVTVKPRLYVAFGISGALHHLAGMQNSQTIVAVNTDPDAPIFGYADLGAVADVHEVVEHLQALI